MNLRKFLLIFLILMLSLQIFQCEARSSDPNFIVQVIGQSNKNSASSEITCSIYANLTHDQDEQWRYYVTINVTNTGQNNITVLNIETNVLNVTYLDGDFEEWGIQGNATVNQVVSPSSSIFSDWTLTQAGFPKEPKIVWVQLSVYVLGSATPLTKSFAIPELSSLLVFPSAILLTLIAIFIRRRLFTRFC